MKNKSVILLILCALFAMQLMAQNEVQNQSKSLAAASSVVINNPILAFLQMPDSLMPYLDQQRKMRMLDLYRTGNTSGVENLLGGVGTTITDITEKAISVSISPNYKFSILLSDDCFYLIETCCSPICASVVRKYIANWIFQEQIKTDPNNFIEATVENDSVVYVNHTSELDVKL